MSGCTIKRTPEGKVDKVFLQYNVKPTSEPQRKDKLTVLADYLTDKLGIPVVNDQDTFDSYVDMVDHPMRNSKGEIYGFTHNGVIFLNPTVAGHITLMHELYHVYEENLRNAANAGNGQAAVILKKRNDITNEIFEHSLAYPNEIPETYRRREGELYDEYAERLRGEIMARLIENNSDEFVDFIERESKNSLRDWINEFFEWVASVIGFNGMSGKEIMDMSKADFIKAIIQSQLKGDFGGKQSYELREIKRTIRRNQMDEILTEDGKVSKLHKDIQKHYKDLTDDQVLTLYAQTRTQAFKEWFEGSTVVDSNGEPLLVFRGLSHPSFEGQDRLQFFTTDFQYSSIFGGINVFPFFLNIKKPFLLNKYNNWIYNRIGGNYSTASVVGLQKELDDYVVNDRGTLIFEIFKSDIQSRFDMGSSLIEEVLPEEFKDEFYNDYENADGFVGKEGATANTPAYVTKSATQIKSLFNFGGFQVDEKSPYYSVKYPTKPQPVESKLFSDIVASPIVRDSEDAVDVFLTSKSKKFMSDVDTKQIHSLLKYDTGEPKVFYETDGQVFDSYREALKNTSSKVISLGILNAGSYVEGSIANSVADVTKNGKVYTLSSPEIFVPLKKVQVSFNTETPAGMVNTFIKTGHISDQKIMVNGVASFIGEGHNNSHSSFNMEAVIDEFSMNPFVYNLVKDSETGTFSFEYEMPNEFVSVSEDGSTTRLTPDEIESALISGNSKIQNLGDLGLKKAMLDGVQIMDNDLNYSGVNPELLDMAISFLRSIGVEVTSIEKYAERYRTKNGVDPSATALADFANKIIAFKDGNITQGELLEELAHFMVEAFDGNGLNDALNDVVNTPEYAEHAEAYRKAYASQAKSAEELETLVRKEVLGKILAKSIASNFETAQDAPASKKSLIAKLVKLFNDFLAKVKSMFNSETQTKLDELVDTLTESLLNQNYTQFNADKVAESSHVLYHLNNVEDFQIKMIIHKMMRSRDVLQRAVSNPSSRNRLKNIYGIDDLIKDKDEFGNRLPEAEQFIRYSEAWSSLLVATGVSKSEIEYLEKALSEHANGDKKLSPQEWTAIAALRDTMMPFIKEARDYIHTIHGDGKNLKVITPEEYNKLIKSMDELIESFAIIEGRYSRAINEEAFLGTVMEEVRRHHNWSEESYQKVKDSLNETYKDVNILARVAGSLVNRKHPLLGIIALQGYQINARANRTSQAIITPIVDKIYKLGLDKYLPNLQLKDDDGNPIAFLISPIDIIKGRKAFDEHRINTIADLLGKTPEEVKANKLRITGNPRLQGEYNLRLAEWSLENLEQPFIPEYYRAQLQRIRDNKINGITYDFLKHNNSKVREILAKHTDPQTGRRDRSNLTEPELKIINEAFRTKQLQKSPYLLSGQLRDSFRKNAAGEVEVIPKDELSDDNLTDDDVIARDLYILDEVYKKENEGKFGNDRSIDFDKKLESITDAKQAYNFLLANGGIAFNDTYWTQVTEQTSYISKLESAIRNNPMDDAKRQTMLEQLETYKDLLNQKRILLKANKVHNSPMEVDASQEHKQELLRIEESLYNLRKVFPTVIDEAESSTVPFDYELSLNNAYYSDLRADKIEEGTPEELEFLKKHMIPSKKEYFSVFKVQLENFIKSGRTGYLSDSAAKVLKQAESEVTGDDAILTRALIIYARNSVASYYSRVAPKGTEELLKAFENGQIHPVTLLNRDPRLASAFNGASQYLTISPNYDWRDSGFNPDNVNPNYEEGKEFFQYRRDKYSNDEFFSRYGISKDSYKNGTQFEGMTATKNKEEFELLKLMVQMRANTLENNGDTTTQSRFSLPQISRQKLEKVFDVFKKGGLKTIQQNIKDLVTFRPDEYERGQEIDQTPIAELSDIRVVPKYYTQPLDESSDLSRDVLGMLVMDNRASHLYRERRKAESNMLLTLGQLGRTKIKGKAVSDSNTLRMAKEYTDQFLYGIKQNFDYKIQFGGRTINLSKLLNSINSKIVNLNLKLNPIVDLTGATTMFVGRKTLDYSGEFYHKSSAALARKRWSKMTRQYVAESGQVNKTSELNHIFEFLGIQDIEDRTTNAIYSRQVRLASKSGFGLSKLSNMTGTPILTLTGLEDFRYDSESKRFVNSRDFFDSMYNELTQEEKLAKWNEMSKQTFYNTVDYTTGVPDFKPEFKQALQNEGVDTDELLGMTQERVAGYVKRMNSIVDGVLSPEDRIFAQRNAVLKFLTTHRGWYTIAADKRFKARQMNFVTGQEEVGHYTMLYEWIKDAINKARKEGTGLRGIIQNYQNAEGGLTPTEKAALRTIQFDFIAFGVLAAVGMLVVGALAASDNDDSWLAHFLALLLIRTFSEVTSTTLVGQYQSGKEVIKDPIVGVRLLETVETLFDFDSLGDEVKGGKTYDGLTKFQRALVKLSLAKRYYQLNNIQSTYNDYRYYNSETLMFLGKGGFAERLATGE